MKPNVHIETRGRASLLPMLLSVLFLAACGDGGTNQENVGAMQGAAPTGAPAQPRMEDGIQVVEIEAGQAGYRPGRIELRAGVPVRLVFTRTTDAACMEQVQIPDLGIERTDLPVNEPVAVEFTPREGGEFTFVCGMNMQGGTLVVKA